MQFDNELRIYPISTHNYERRVANKRASTTPCIFLFCFVLVISRVFRGDKCGLFKHIVKDYFDITGALKSPCRVWSKIDRYQKTAKHHKSQTMCLFVGRYSLSIESAAGASVYSVAAILVCGEVGSYDSNGLFY